MTVIIQESDLLPESLDSDLSGIRKEADSRTVPDRPDKDSLRQDTLTENLTRKPLAVHLPHPIFFYVTADGYSHIIIDSIKYVATTSMT